ncbi:hypothetical protein [Nocardia asteroides]|uniref:Uncharacterized protein n=1 Tax=Nocardia asteroides NBRC 15531 TaxID=1110697 RepID=U5E6T7_NOCAS|nr:hypothetical protein [Nocardia asteroides]UGT50292.1 hypothetical protein LT345_06855 [Nocardia asteroides]GAD82021.1 hypothetical protein NCAST_05_04580 [Nocardia asteroides NBRC 15531]SFN13124.1 hypothetical protein SAMN05444423_106213 [Nocardia asteroides]VEG36924.1 Uncharacterised protein [Nocardia asteroides]
MTAIMPVPLDEYPVHQTPLSLARVATSDRNFYDRYYFNAFDPAGDTMLITGFGVYPNLGVVDAFATVRHGDRQRSVRFSDALTARDLTTAVGGYRIEVIEPLQRLRVVCEHDDLAFDLTWTGAHPAVQEQPHLILSGTRPIIEASRFAQLGSWSGTLAVDGRDYTVDPATWTGSRDRSWGIRPSGEPEPPGRAAAEGAGGFWWLYAPLRFDDFAIVVIVQEEPDGTRTLNNAVRIWHDGRKEQLGWPRMHWTYESGTRHPKSVRLDMTTPDGKPLEVEIESRPGIALHVGCGYGPDPDWTHGRWMGRDWSLSSDYDLTDPAIVGRTPYGVIDHIGYARCGDAEGWGLFEHASMGRHDPTGFADWSSVAP